MSQTKFDELKETLKTLIQKDLDEASVTGAIDGGEGPPKTPFAFGRIDKEVGKRKKNKKREIEKMKQKQMQAKEESIANQSGYTIAEAKFAVKFQLGKSAGETATIIVDVGSKGAAEQIVAKNLKRGRKGIVSVKRVEAGKAKQIDKKLENVTEALKSKSNVVKLASAVMSNMEDLVEYRGNDYDKAVNAFGTMIKNSLERISKMNIKPHPQYDYSDKRSAHPMIKDEKSHLKFLKDYKMLTKKMIPLFKALINKPSKPGIMKLMKYYNSSKYQEMNSVIATGDFGNNHVIESITEGKYHDFRNDESLSPKQKIGRSMMEVRDTLKTLESIVGMNIRLKNEIGVDSTSYWKRTHTAMKKISERLVKLANKVGQLH